MAQILKARYYLFSSTSNNCENLLFILWCKFNKHN